MNRAHEGTLRYDALAPGGEVVEHRPHHDGSPPLPPSIRVDLVGRAVLVLAGAASVIWVGAGVGDILSA